MAPRRKLSIKRVKKVVSTVLHCKYIHMFPVRTFVSLSRQSTSAPSYQTNHKSIFLRILERTFSRSSNYNYFHWKWLTLLALKTHHLPLVLYCEQKSHRARNLPCISAGHCPKSFVKILTESANSALRYPYFPQVIIQPTVTVEYSY